MSLYQTWAILQIYWGVRGHLYAWGGNFRCICVYVCVWKCQMSCWWILVGLIARAARQCAWVHYTELTQSWPEKAEGNKSVCVCVCVWSQKDHWVVDNFLEKRAKLSCLTSLIDALPKKSVTAPCQRSCSEKSGRGSDILDSQPVLLQRRKEMKIDGEMKGVQRRKTQGEDV